MFNNVGKKIMLFAKIEFWISLIAGIIAFFVLIGDAPGIAFACLGGGFAFIVTAWFIYAFGQLVDDVHSMKHSSPSVSNGGTGGHIYDDLPDL